ncbi:hypothetical protein WS73_09080 [Burkholderia savannae]|nr:hypothetical protein WS73_09080 [Burkholderia savannae]
MTRSGLARRASAARFGVHRSIFGGGAREGGAGRSAARCGSRRRRAPAITRCERVDAACIEADGDNRPSHPDPDRRAARCERRRDWRRRIGAT